MSTGDHHGSNNADLPEDIITSEVLVRLPVKSVLRFKCASKSWHAIISSHRFIQLHTQQQAKKKSSQRLLITPLNIHGQCASPLINSNKICLYTYNGEGRSRTASLCFAKEIPCLPAILLRPQHANGLLLLNFGFLLVCNPSTNECMRLPECSHNARHWLDHNYVGLQSVGLGFVRSTNTYKLVHYFYRSFNRVSRTWTMGSEVFTLGADSSWRATKDDPPFPADGRSVASVGEFVYFRIDKRLHISSPEVLFFSFNLKDETFRMIHLPRRPLNYDKMGFLELECDTCFMNLSVSGTKLDLWINKDPTMDVWMHTFNINLHRPANMVYPVAIHQGKLLLFKKNFSSKLIYYNPQNESFEKEVDLAKNLRYIDPGRRRQNPIFHELTSFQVISCMDTLVSVNAPTLVA